jgi:hypothetical protein
MRADSPTLEQVSLTAISGLELNEIDRGMFNPARWVLMLKSQ